MNIRYNTCIRIRCTTYMDGKSYKYNECSTTTINRAAVATAVHYDERDIRKAFETSHRVELSKRCFTKLPLFSSSLSLCSIIMAQSIYCPFIYLCRAYLFFFLFSSALFAFGFNLLFFFVSLDFLEQILFARRKKTNRKKNETRFFAQSDFVLQSTENCSNCKSVANISVTN